MSYPAPPPPGGAGSPNPYQGPPYGGPGGPGPGGPGGPVGTPPKKNNTVWWIVGIIAAVVLVCCCGAAGFFVFVANEASDSVSSVNASKNGDAASGVRITEGGTAVVDGANIRPGWSASSDDINGLVVRNDSGSRDSFYLTFYFMKDGNVLDDITCSTKFLDDGSSDYSPNCVGAVFDIDDADEIRVTEGF